MTKDLEQCLRGPAGYSLARAALAAMERQKVWPTPLNFDLWLRYLAAPTAPLGVEVARLVAEGCQITDALAEELAARHLPKGRLTEEVKEAGDQLHRQLEHLSEAISTAQQSTAEYGRTLAGASSDLQGAEAPVVLQEMVATLAAATQRIELENSSLEQRLSASTEEIGQLRAHLQEVRREAMTDALTGLSNRKTFDETLASACAEADARGDKVCLALIDIDHFKIFNDTWGHQTGDQVLRYVASVIARRGAAPRLAARFGGEEFAIVLPQARLEDVRGECDLLRQEISSRALKRRSTSEDLGSVTVSVGVAERLPGESPASLLGRVDAALYVSKRAGRDRVSLAEPDLPARGAGEEPRAA